MDPRHLCIAALPCIPSFFVIRPSSQASFTDTSCGGRNKAGSRMVASAQLQPAPIADRSRPCHSFARTLQMTQTDSAVSAAQQHAAWSPLPPSVFRLLGSLSIAFGSERRAETVEERENRRATSDDDEQIRSDQMRCEAMRNRHGKDERSVGDTPTGRAEDERDDTNTAMHRTVQ